MGADTSALSRGLGWVQRALWILLILWLPVTSMPLVRDLVGSDSVAAPSGLAMAGLLLLFLLPWVLRRGALPRQSLLLLAFASVFLVCGLVTSLLPLPLFKEVSPLRNFGVASLTLMVGMGFYLVAATYPRDEARLSQTIRLINWSGLLILVWSLVQAAVWYTLLRYPDALRSFQEIFSPGPLYRQRPTGFALEPSWLAHQLNMLYLPVWLAFSVQRTSVHRWRIWKFSFENLLLAGGVVVLLLSLSRVGLLAFLLGVAFLFVQGHLRLVRWLQEKLIRQPALLTARRRLISAGLFVGLAVVYLLMLGGVGYGLSRVDPRMRNLFQFSFTGGDVVQRLSKELVFAERVVYWQAGWNVFAQHPWVGVGPGHAGYFFSQALPSEAWSLIEVRRLMYRAESLPNVKSFWVRLLAETGLLGFALFLAWEYVLWQTARTARASAQPLLRALGLAGALALIVFTVEGFSLDSFAMPYYWVTLGLMTAGSLGWKITTKETR